MQNVRTAILDAYLHALESLGGNADKARQDSILHSWICYCLDDESLERIRSPDHVDGSSVHIYYREQRGTRFEIL